MIILTQFLNTVLRGGEGRARCMPNNWNLTAIAQTNHVKLTTPQGYNEIPNSHLLSYLIYARESNN